MTPLEKLLFALLFVAVIVLGVFVYNINSNIGVIDEKGRNLTAWAQEGATWAKHVNADHLKADHIADGLAPSHIPPPTDPPPRW